MKPLGRFPERFKWCVATSAHQVEGDNSNSDWWEFEHTPGMIRDGKPSGAACDHWNRLEQDTALIANLGANQYRFSVEWAKIEPRPGEFNSAALDHYRHEISLLKAQGIQPFVTLHHFTLPLWVAQRGGFAWDGIADAFEGYTRAVYEAIGSEVEDWSTINEPQTLIGAGYIEGVFPPRLKDIGAIGAPILGMIRSHARAYHVLHQLASQRGKRVRVGLAHHLRVFQPARRWNPLDLWVTRLVDQVANWAFVDALQTGKLRAYIPFTLNIDEEIPEAKGTQDFIGLNYYSRDLIAFSPTQPGLIERRTQRGAPVSDLGWEIYPEGIYRLAKRIHKKYPGLSIHIMENGLADHRDQQRQSFIRDHLQQVLRALGEGVPIEGYCYWSLMDNYEWAEGFEPRFGLYEVNYDTQERTLRPSGVWFSKVIQKNRLE